jgi:3'(2'), 5'-bisphosphate nucleotidase
MKHGARSSDHSALAVKLTEIVKQAGDVLMGEFGAHDLGMHVKRDGSPVLRADMLSNDALEAGLTKVLDIPILSEESRIKQFPAGDQAFFVVDPLDGTKEFVKASPDFAINLALVEAGKPVLGIIYAPATKSLFCGIAGHGSWVMRPGEAKSRLNVSARTKDSVGIVGINHVLDADIELLGILGCTKILRRGSSLKFTAIATGEADIYARTGRTMIWDTAAAYVIVEEAGGYVHRLVRGLPTAFKLSLDNTGFICANRRLDPRKLQKYFQDASAS